MIIWRTKGHRPGHSVLEMAGPSVKIGVHVCVNIHKMTIVFRNSLALEPIMARHVGHTCNPMINPSPSHTLLSFTDLGLIMKKHVRIHLI